MKSEVIIFDEPTAALDPVNAEMLETVLEKLGIEGKTMLISTHDVDFVYRWAQRAIVFNQGRIIADGSPLEIFKNETILQQANLKRPMMLEVYEMLVAKGLIKEDGNYPTCPKELNELLTSNN